MAKLVHSNLYVKNIPPEVDETTLKNIFAPYGAIESCRLFRSPKPGTNSYAFVKYAEIDEAQSAIDNLHGATVGEASLEVKPAETEPGNSPIDNLYVKGLPHHYTEHDFLALFSPFGTITEHKFLPAQDINLTSSGLVRFSSVQEATRALQALNMSIPPKSSRQMFIKYADTPEEKARKAQKQQSRMPPSTRYSPYPSPRSSVMTGGLGPSMAGGLPAYEPGFPGGLGGGPLPVYGQDPVFNGAVGPSSIYIKYLPPTADKLFLYENFGAYGGVVSVKVLEDDEGRCRGVGFVNYVDHPSAQRAVQNMNGVMLSEAPLVVTLQHKK